MAKKRRKPRTRARAGATSTAPRSGETPGAATKPGREPRPSSTSRPSSERAERKELARHERELARRRIARQRSIRRMLTIAGMAGVIGIAAFLVFRADAPGDVSAEALEVGRAAGCGDVLTPAASAPGGQHLGAGESANYTNLPASSGVHAASPLPPDRAVYTQPIDEEAAVHNLEHGYILLYYRADDPGALPEDALARLSEIAEGQDKVLVAPYPQLAEGTSLAMVAWNKLWECPSTVSAADSATMANAFIAAYKSTSNAPEGNVP